MEVPRGEDGPGETARAGTAWLNGAGKSARRASVTPTSPNIQMTAIDDHSKKERWLGSAIPFGKNTSSSSFTIIMNAKNPTQSGSTAPTVLLTIRLPRLDKTDHGESVLSVKRM